MFALPVVHAAADESESRLKEALRAVHALGLASEFRDAVNRTIENVAKTHAEYPISHWDEVRRLASAENYLQMAVTTFAGELSLGELQAVNDIVCEPVTFKVMKAAMKLAGDVEPQELGQRLQDLKRIHSAKEVDKYLAFVGGELGYKFHAVLDKIYAGEREHVINALMEAQKTIRARNP